MGQAFAKRSNGRGHDKQGSAPGSRRLWQDSTRTHRIRRRRYQAGGVLSRGSIATQATTPKTRIQLKNAIRLPKRISSDSTIPSWSASFAPFFEWQRNAGRKSVNFVNVDLGDSL